MTRLWANEAGLLILVSAMMIAGAVAHGVQTESLAIGISLISATAQWLLSPLDWLLAWPRFSLVAPPLVGICLLRLT